MRVTEMPANLGSYANDVDPRRLRRSAVLRFALSGLVAVALLAWAVIHVVRDEVRSASVEDAKAVTRLAGEGVIAPQLTPALLAGDPAARRRFDRLVRERVLRDPIVRLKLWTADGRVVYSDEPRLVGRRFDLKQDAREALEHGGITAEVSDGSNAENRFEGDHRKLLEVYVTLRAPDGRPVLYEAYMKYGVAAASGTKLWQAILPALLGGLILLWLVQVPMAAGLARRVRRGQDEREALLRRAVEASSLERRRIARDLHDGPVQRLAAMSYALSAAGRRMRSDGREDTAVIVDGTAHAARETLRELRTMLVDLYPPTLQREGLEAALTDLLAPLRSRAVSTSLSVDPGVVLPASDEALVYRVAQEALRNVAAHADARSVDVRVAAGDRVSVLEIVDDGRGFDPHAAREPDRHFGLRMVADTVRDLGGHFVVRSSPGGGTTIRLEVPT